jgi:hypothetical protein
VIEKADLNVKGEPMIEVPAVTVAGLQERQALRHASHVQRLDGHPFCFNGHAPAQKTGLLAQKTSLLAQKIGLLTQRTGLSFQQTRILS